MCNSRSHMGGERFLHLPWQDQPRKPCLRSRHLSGDSLKTITSYLRCSPRCENTCSLYPQKLKSKMLHRKNLLECHSRHALVDTSELMGHLCIVETLGQALLAPPRLGFTMGDRWLWFSFGDTLTMCLMLSLNLFAS